MTEPAALPQPAAFFLANRERVRAAGRLGPIVDLACGRGRNALATAALGARCVAVDRNPNFLGALRATGEEHRLNLEIVRADLETEHGIPLRSESCGAVLVFRFLYRPLAPAVEALLCPGGLLLYETFTLRQRELGGGPRNPAFLLEDGELPTLFPGLEVVIHEEVVADAATARLVARKPSHA